MVCSRRWWGWWVALALVVSAGPVWAGGGAKENRAWRKATTEFQAQLWPLAETDLAQFAQNFPDSTRLPEAFLLEAQAQLHQNKVLPAITLLSARLPAGGGWREEYQYWLGEAQYQNGDWGAAAATWEGLPDTSPRALRTTVEAGAALAQLGHWSELIHFLAAKPFLTGAAEVPGADADLIQRGRLLVAQADFSLGDMAAARLWLERVVPAALPTDLAWQRWYLMGQVQLTAGDRAGALAAAQAAVALARTNPDSAASQLPASLALQARALSALGREQEAGAAWQATLQNEHAPEAQQREALLKIAALAMKQGQVTNATAWLEEYAARFTNAPALDLAWLTLGELYLQTARNDPATPVWLGNARARLTALLARFPDSPLAAKAWLDTGWCDWLAWQRTGHLSEPLTACVEDFQKAAAQLPPSADRAVAEFKLGDAWLARGNDAAALTHYQNVRGWLADDFPEIARTLGEPALYQIFRAQLRLGDLAAAEASMRQLMADYPLSTDASPAALLLGEAYTDLRQPTNALAVFESFQTRLPDSPLRPLVALAIARAEEEQGQWRAAVARYDLWLQQYTNEDLRPRAVYARAWANYVAGNETNAFLQFTNFLGLYPHNELAPRAQWWVADHYFRLGDSVNAERNYKTIFQNLDWQTNELYYPALMMAGRAAVSRTDNAAAIRDYFVKLENDTNCPLDLRVQATFAHGTALMKMDSPDTNNPTTNFFTAVTIFTNICISFPTNELGARAWLYIGDCFLQLGRFTDATNAYGQAMSVPDAVPALHDQAQTGLGLGQEKQAALLPAGEARKALLYQALGNYLEVFNEPELERDPIWSKRAGLRAAELAAALEEWLEAINVYTRLGEQLPQLKASLTPKIAAAREHLQGRSAVGPKP